MSDNNNNDPRESLFSFCRIKNLVKGKQDTSVREAIEEYIDELAEDSNGKPAGLLAHERDLISNVLTLRDRTVLDVMVPRADIIAIDLQTSKQDLLELLSEKQFSRLPVYQENLDQVLGTIHIKDILACLAKDAEELDIKSLIRDVPVVSPSLPVLDLLSQMKETKKHMVLVVDEFGGIDGMVTIGDLIETIFGEIEDEFVSEEELTLKENDDGSIITDARYDIETFEKEYGTFLSEEEREETDTLGGLIFFIAGRVPTRGEVIKHENSQIVFEIMDADPRRIKRVKIRNVPHNH